MVARPDNVVVHVSPESLRSKADPVSVTCAAPVHVDPSPISQEELQAALARVPPTEQRIEITNVIALPIVDGRLRVQGRGRGFVNGGTPWNVAVSYASGQPAPLPTQSNSGAQLEVGLPASVASTCEEAARTALRNGKTLEVTGVGLFRAGSTGAASFGLFVLDRVTSCSCIAESRPS
jgi:hypothetical protein